MRTLSATFKIVTPMFLGDADQAARDIRPASVKGALRFWWRALRWAQAIKEAQGDGPAAMRWLHAREAQLFGASASDSGRGGQGVFLMQVRTEGDRCVVVDQPFGKPGPGQLYLLGQGLGKFGTGCTRSSLQPGQTFELLVRFKPGVSAADGSEIVEAVKVFGWLGALGSRARHGMGSVALTSLTYDESRQELPDSVAQYAAALKGLLASTTGVELPLYTAFSATTRIDISACGTDALRLLEKVGATQQYYRLWGRDGKVNGQPARQLFKTDHDVMFLAANGESVWTAPERAVFGLPHNYFFFSTKKKADVNARIGRGGKEDVTRRASPLLLHIHPFNGGSECAAVHVMLPALFLPEGGGIAINRQREVIAARPKWSVIYNYLAEYQKDRHYQNVIQGERVND